ncbi:MAG: sugar phosphate nucleotidyltransferase, partial [Chloroflexota bacterium]|nr:sugar phosphate nucleotidyltransferase [Chloroflexota bacterium]
MWGVIPVAGKGTRLYPLTLDKPKALLELRGRPILERLVERIVPVITHLCLVVGENELLFRAAIGDRIHGIAVHYVTQSSPVGVADAICRAEAVVSGPFLALMGDNYFDESLVPYIEGWQQSGADGAILVEQTEESSRDPVGIVEVERGSVLALTKASFQPGMG